MKKVIEVGRDYDGTEVRALDVVRYDGYTYIVAAVYESNGEVKLKLLHRGTVLIADRERARHVYADSVVKEVRS